MVQQDHDILRMPLLLLKLSGRNPHMEWKKYLFSLAIYTITFVIFYTVVLVHFFYLDGSLIHLVANCEGVATLFQIYGKIVVTTFYKNDIVKLIATAKSWSIEGTEENVKKKLELILMTTLYMQRIFSRGMIVNTCIMVITPFFSNQLPTGVWNIPNHDNLHKTIFIIEEIFCPPYVLSAVGLDCLFLALCILVIIQLKILRNRLKRMKVSDISNDTERDNYLKELKSCIKRHEFLLKYIKSMSNTYSPIMLMEYISICIVAFAEMYLVFKSDSTVHFIRGVLFLTAGSIQICFYCIPAHFTTSEATEVASAIYQSDWYSQFVPNLRNTLLISMQRAQKEAKFSAGRLVDMNMKTLISVWQFAWSVCTIMRGLENL